LAEAGQKREWPGRSPAITKKLRRWRYYRAAKAARNTYARARPSRDRRLEATGAQNFLDLDDVSICDEGELVDAKTTSSDA
jgi:hypothetical protein